MLASLTPSSQYRQWRQRRTTHTHSCWPGHHRFWPIAEETLPSCGCADTGRARSQGHIQHGESISHSVCLFNKYPQHQLTSTTSPSLLEWKDKKILGIERRNFKRSHSKIQIKKHYPVFFFQVASVTVVHVPDDKYSLSARVLFQYLLTSQGNMYELKVCHIF